MSANVDAAGIGGETRGRECADVAYKTGIIGLATNADGPPLKSAIFMPTVTITKNVAAARLGLSIINIRRIPMQLIELNNTAMPKGDSIENVLIRDVLKLSDLDADLMSDLSSMFGKWFEADHCDKEIS